MKYPTRVAVAWLLALLSPSVFAQSPKNFFQEVLGMAAVDEQPMLSGDAPSFGFLVANESVRPAGPKQGNVLPLEVDGIPVELQLSQERQGSIDLYTIRHAPGSELRGEQVKVSWTLPQGYNESMTLDAGALQGLPLYLPTHTVPDNLFTNWGTLFYHRHANVVVGTQLTGAEHSRHARRGHSRFSGVSTFQLMTTTGHPEMAITFFAYRPADERFWWAEWYQLRSKTDPTLPANLFPIFTAVDMSWAPGDRQQVNIVPGPDDAGKPMELVIIDELARTETARVAFEYELPVTHVSVDVGDWASSLYRLILAPAGAAVDPADINLDEKLTNVFVRSPQSRGDVLFVAPTDMWYAYSTNGSHDYHGWRTGYDDSAGYSPTVMSSRRRRLNHFYYSLYGRYNDLHHYRFVDKQSREDGFTVDYATQQDVSLGRVSLDDYKLVIIGSHCEFTTVESYRRFTEYMGWGGAVFVHGGDSFAVLVEYLPSLEEPRYIWQRGHLWAHLSDQPSGFRAPNLLPGDAVADTPIVNPDPGDAIDYLNPFHNSVDYWVPGSPAVIADESHPIFDGMGLKRGDRVPGQWGGEVDIPYEPHAWDVLIRSVDAEPAGREFGIDAFDNTPIHRVGLAAHKNLRLAMITGENFPNILGDPANTRYHEIYRRTIRYYLETAWDLKADHDAAGIATTEPTLLSWEQPVKLHALRYDLPQFIDFDNSDWHRGSAPYAHYTVEGSRDGRAWFVLANRTHGPWRARQTDFFNAVEVRYIRWRGSFSNGERFRVRNVEAYRAPPE